MADITVTAASVRPMPGAVIQRYQAGEAMDIGTAVYLKSDGKVWKADADAAASSMAIGLVVSAPNGATAAAADDYVDVVVRGVVTGAASMTPGGLVYSSTTAGAVADASPAGSSGDYRWIVGYAVSATGIYVMPFTDNFAAL